MLADGPDPVLRRGKTELLHLLAVMPYWPPAPADGIILVLAEGPAAALVVLVPATPGFVPGAFIKVAPPLGKSGARMETPAANLGREIVLPLFYGVFHDRWGLG